MSETAERLSVSEGDLCIEVAGTPWGQVYSVVDGVGDVLLALGFKHPRPYIYSGLAYYQWGDVYDSENPYVWELFVGETITRVRRARDSLSDGGHAAYRDDIAHLRGIPPVSRVGQDERTLLAFFEALEGSSSQIRRVSFDNRFLHFNVGGVFHALACLEARRLEGVPFSEEIIDEWQRRLLDVSQCEDHIFVMLLSPDDVTNTVTLEYVRALARAQELDLRSIGWSAQRRAVALGYYNLGALRILEKFSNQLPPVEVLEDWDGAATLERNSSFQEALAGLWMGRLLTAVKQLLPEFESNK